MLNHYNSISQVRDRLIPFKTKQSYEWRQSQMKNKYSYTERLGALLYSMNRMNTYMGRVTEADRDCIEVLRGMQQH